VAQKGTQASELLTAFAQFSSDHRFQVYTVGSSRVPSAITGSLAVFPDFDFKTAPDPEILVIPSIANWNEPQLIQWLKAKLPTVKWIVALSEGARALGAAGYLQSQKITTHPSAAEDIRSYSSRLQILLEKRALRDGHLITSRAPGAVSEALRLLPFFNQRTSTDQQWDFPLWRIGMNSQTLTPHRIGAEDLFFMFLSGGFQWHRPGVGVLIYPGVNERDLAAALDTYNHSWHSRTVTFSNERRIINTQHGLKVIPTLGSQDLPVLDVVVIPSGKLTTTPISAQSLDIQKRTVIHPLELPGIEEALKKSGTQLRRLDFYNNPKPAPYVAMYRMIEELSSFANAQFAAQWIDYPRTSDPYGGSLLSKLPKMIWLRLLGLALMGMTVCGYISRKLSSS